MKEGRDYLPREVSFRAGGRFSTLYSTTSLSERTSWDLFLSTVVARGVFPCKSVQHRSVGTPDGLEGHRISVSAAEVIHGKTGPPPRGAVLFGPFSYAHKKKDEEKMKIERTTEGNDLTVQEQNPASGFPAFPGPSLSARNRSGLIRCVGSDESTCDRSGCGPAGVARYSSVITRGLDRPAEASTVHVPRNTFVSARSRRVYAGPCL